VCQCLITTTFSSCHDNRHRWSVHVVREFLYFTFQFFHLLIALRYIQAYFVMNEEVLFTYADLVLLTCMSFQCLPAGVNCIGRTTYKSSPKKFDNFSRTIWHNILHTIYSCTFNYSQMCKVSLHYLQNWQNYAAFSLGNLIKNCLHYKQHKSEHFEQRKMLRMFTPPFTYSCQIVFKTRDSWVNWTCGKLSKATFNSETFQALDEGFKTCVAGRSQDIHMAFKLGELLGGHCSFSIIYRQFL